MITLCSSWVDRTNEYRSGRGHPYFIDGCGGAVEESVCVECRAPIGGRDYNYVSHNV